MKTHYKILFKKKEMKADLFKLGTLPVIVCEVESLEALCFIYQTPGGPRGNLDGPVRFHKSLPDPV